VAKIGKHLPKMVFFDFFETVSFFFVFVQNCLRCVPRHEKCEKLPKKFKNWSILASFGQFWPHFMNLNHVLKKVGRTRAGQGVYIIR
jgi:hypothetical protein